MSLPVDHASLLARRDFVIPPGDFTDAERALLSRYGRWLDALACGAIAPTTSEQSQFVKVALGQREPETAFECAWMKVIRERDRVEEVVQTFQRLARARSTSAEIESEYRAARAAILALVHDKLEAVDQAFAGRIQDAASEAAAAEQAVRDLVLRLGRGVRLAGIRAAYYPGRVSWDTKQLEQYAVTHQEVAAFRKVGKAWVNLRFLDASDPAAAPGMARAIQPSGSDSGSKMQMLPAAEAESPD